MKNKGFTLVELLAVIVILAIILVIAVPGISGLIQESTISAFKDDAKMVLKAIDYKTINDISFDPTTLNASNVKSLLDIDDSNYKSISVSLKDNIPYVLISGKNKWSNLTALGSYSSMQVISSDGLILLLDASNPVSYPGTGSTWYDLSGQNANGTINGAVSWVSNGQKSYFNFPANADGDFISTATSQNYRDIFILFQPDFSVTSFGSSISMLVSSGSDKSIRFCTGSVPWTIACRNPGDTNDWAYPAATTYYMNGVASNVLPASGWVALSGFRTNTTEFSPTFSLRISGGYAYRNFSGKVAFVAMYNRQLTETEVKQMFNSIRSRFGI